MTKPIKVPTVQGPRKQLCWQQPPLVGSVNPMVHCDRQKGHGGAHVWELTQASAKFRAWLENEAASYDGLVKVDLREHYRAVLARFDKDIAVLARFITPVE